MKKHKNISVSTSIIVAFIIITFITPVVINLLLFLPYPSTPVDLGNKDWLAFWGSFLGGGIGGIATLFAVYYTLMHNIEQNHSNLNYQREASRMDIIPYIDVRIFLNEPMGNPSYFMFKDLFEEQSVDKEEIKNEEKIIQFPSGYVLFKTSEISYSNILDKKYKIILEQGGIEQRKEGSTISLCQSNIREVGISLCNIGITSAIDVTLELNSNSFNNYAVMPSFNLKVNELIVLNLIFDRDFPEGENLFTVKFSDLKGNIYKQRFKIKIKEQRNYLERITPPELITMA